MEDHVVEAVVAVHQRGLIRGGDVGGQPDEEILHRLDGLGLGGAVLLAPAPDLAREVVAGLAVVRKARRRQSPACAARTSTWFISS